jgi:hypothetical protein
MMDFFLKEILKRGFNKFGNSPLGVLRWAFSKYQIQYTALIEALDEEAYKRYSLDEIINFVPEARVLWVRERQQ